MGCALIGIRICKFYLERAPVVSKKQKSTKLMLPRGGLPILVSPDKDSNLEVQSASGGPYTIGLSVVRRGRGWPDLR